MSKLPPLRPVALARSIESLHRQGREHGLSSQELHNLTAGLKLASKKTTQADICAIQQTIIKRAKERRASC